MKDAFRTCQVDPFKKSRKDTPRAIDAQSNLQNSQVLDRFHADKMDRRLDEQEGRGQVLGLKNDRFGRN
jgi:hypothetical protein